jgi:hypothetical protein
MDSIAPPKPVEDLPLAPKAPASSSDPGPAADAAERRVAEHAAALRSNLAPDRLVVQLDATAQRFVQTL